jgi:uncharacterized repeat protein (TIGR03803 family)
LAVIAALVLLWCGEASAGASILHQFKGGTAGSPPSHDSPIAVDKKSGAVYGIAMVVNGNNTRVIYGVYRLSPPAAAGGRWGYRIIFTLDDIEYLYHRLGPLAVGPDGTVYVAADNVVKCKNSQAVYPECSRIFSLKALNAAGTQWQTTVLYDGKTPDEWDSSQALVYGGPGLLYISASNGPGYNDDCGGCGVIFELRRPAGSGRPWTKKVLHHFSDKPEVFGCHPAGALAVDSEGNLYGAAIQCGTLINGLPGAGTVFRLLVDVARPYNMDVLWTFAPSDSPSNPQALGNTPMGGLMRVGTTLYGMTSVGSDNNMGTLFRMNTAGGQRTVLWRFNGRDKAVGPLSADAAGNIYWTSYYSGVPNDGTTGCCGDIHTLNRANLFNKGIVYKYTGKADGEIPQSGVAFGPGNRLFAPSGRIYPNGAVNTGAVIGGTVVDGKLQAFRRP